MYFPFHHFTISVSTIIYYMFEYFEIHRKIDCSCHLNLYIQKHSSPNMWTATTAEGVEGWLNKNETQFHSAYFMTNKIKLFSGFYSFLNIKYKRVISLLGVRNWELFVSSTPSRRRRMWYGPEREAARSPPLQFTVKPPCPLPENRNASNGRNLPCVSRDAGGEPLRHLGGLQTTAMLLLLSPQAKWRAALSRLTCVILVAVNTQKSGPHERGSFSESQPVF